MRNLLRYLGVGKSEQDDSGSKVVTAAERVRRADEMAQAHEQKSRAEPVLAHSVKEPPTPRPEHGENTSPESSTASVTTAANSIAQKQEGYVNWYLEVLKKYAVFEGRARRKEYWYFLLFNFPIGIVLAIIDTVTGTFSAELSMGLLGGIYSLAILTPSLAVTVRRLHDTDHSGWSLLLLLIPIIGAIAIIVFLVKDSKPGENQYGSYPKDATLPLHKTVGQQIREADTELKHSGIGIASFITSIVVIILFFSIFIFAAIVAISTPGGVDEESVEVAVFGIVIIALLLVGLVAIGLGIGGLYQKDRKKIFSILGTTFSSVTVVGIILLMIVGE